MNESCPGQGPRRTSNTDHQTSAPVLRRIRESDLEALYRLDGICFEPGIAYSREDLRRFLRMPGATGFALEEKGKMLAFAIGARPTRRRASVVTLDVDPGHRRRGFARQLLSRLLAELAANGARDIRLEVDVTNAGAIAFYDRFGFRTVARLPGYYGRGRDAFEMAISVASETG